jgi:hypothetical protein
MVDTKEINLTEYMKKNNIKPSVSNKVNMYLKNIDLQEK